MLISNAYKLIIRFESQLEGDNIHNTECELILMLIIHMVENAMYYRQFSFTIDIK